MIKNMIMRFGLCFLLMGCGANGINLRIKFDHVEGLKKHDRVIFEKNQIGRVSGVQYVESGFFHVQVIIKKEFEKAVTEHSRFFIVSDPQDETRKIVEMVLMAKGGTPLKDGITVAGTSRQSALLDKMWKTFDEGLDDLESKWKKFSDQLKNIPESETYKDLEKELERFSDEMEKSGQAIREKWENELAPRLKEDLEKLRERLLEPQKEEDPEGPLDV